MAAVAEQSEEQAPEKVVETSPAEKAAPSQLFEFSKFVHVGEGAPECEHGEDGKCQDDGHFHAWVRLPNQLQFKSLREKGLAAEARRRRQLKDPQCDAYLVLEDSLEEVKNDRDVMVELVVSTDLQRDTERAMAELAEEEEFGTIQEDRQRLNALRSLPAEERNADEFDELKRHLAKYNEGLAIKVREAQDPLRQSLQTMETPQLLDQVRKQWIDNETRKAYFDTFGIWQTYICTLTPESKNKQISKRVFESVDQVRDAAPEVVRALEDAFLSLESAIQGGTSAGN